MQAQKHGGTRGNAYSRAGYKASGESAEVNASRLLGNAKFGIAARVREIVGNGAKRAEVTVSSLLGELEQARAGATSVEQYGAVTQAVIGKARIAGLMIDKVAIGSPSEFAACEDIESLMRVFLADQTATQALGTLDRMREAIVDYAASHAEIITVDEPDLPRRANGEASMAIELLRPMQKARR